MRILSEMEAWIKDPDSQHICWITGMAGSGKTSLAKTVCERASTDAEIMLGGSFFCSRSTGLAAQRDIRCVIPTLAQLLALDSVEFCQALADKIKPGVQHKEVAAQVEQLLYTPLLAVKNHNLPILFVIDALDECGGETSDGMLDDVKSHASVTNMLEALINLTRSEFSFPIKFLVTSRPEAQVRDTSISNEHLSHIMRLHAVDADEVDADIRRYITETLTAKLSGKPRLQAMITDRDVDDLVRLCDGLFIVAATVLEHTFGAGIDAAVAKFKRLLNAPRDDFDAGAAAPLDGMYALILMDATRDGREATELPTLLRLLSSLLSARMALSIAALGDLLAVEAYDVRAGLSCLHAVVHVPEDDDMPGLRTVHASFGDYLLSRAPGHIRISRWSGHETLAHGCLDLMGRYLRLNVSSSVSSYEPNRPTRPNHITLSLEYSCLHWAHHVVLCKHSDEANSDHSSFDTVIEQKFRPKFLFWLEVLSVLCRVGLASGLLLKACSSVSWLPVPEKRLNLLQVKAAVLSQFLRDASSFVASSREAIERSAPHIYLSALPFADKTSLVYRDFSPRCTGLITVDTFGIGQHSASTVMTLTGHSGPVHSVTYSIDGLLLASGSEDGTVRVWDTLTGEEALFPLRSGDGSVLSVGFARNNVWVASGTGQGVVCIWDISSGQPRHKRLIGHSAGVNSVVFSPEVTCLASASDDKTLRIWDPETGKQLRVLNGHAREINEIAFSPAGDILASISGDKTIMLWHSTTWQAALEPIEHESYPWYQSVDFSPDGETIVVDSHGKVVFLRRQTGEKIAELYSGGWIKSIRFSPDGRSLVVAHDRDVELWTLHPEADESTSVNLRGHSESVRSATFSPDGLYIASASDDGTIRIWSTESGQSAVQKLPAHDGPVKSVAVSSDGALIVGGAWDECVWVWNAHTGEATLPLLEGHERWINSVAISPDGRLVAAAGADQTVRLWEVQSRAVVGRGEPMCGHTYEVRAVTFSHGGYWLASASDDGTLRIWDVATQQTLAVIPLPCQHHVSTVAFSPDDGLLAAGDSSGHMYLWRTQTGEQVYEPLQGRRLAFSPDGTRIVSSIPDDVACIWDVRTGQPVLHLRGHAKYVCSVAWSFDGHLIGTGSGDRTVRLWDPMTGTMLATLRGHISDITTLAFTFDGQFLVSGSDDTTIRKWDVGKASKPVWERDVDHPAVGLSLATRNQHGWLVGSSGELRLWVPLEYRESLQMAPCALLIGGSRIVIGVGDNGLHAGSNWTACWTG